LFSLSSFFSIAVRLHGLDASVAPNLEQLFASATLNARM
jgi:hypothetical protein